MALHIILTMPRNRNHHQLIYINCSKYFISVTKCETYAMSHNLQVLFIRFQEICDQTVAFYSSLQVKPHAEYCWKTSSSSFIASKVTSPIEVKNNFGNFPGGVVACAIYSHVEILLKSHILVLNWFYRGKASNYNFYQ